MRIVVLGATGSLGRAVVEDAKRRGHDVVAASRKSAVKVDLTTGEGLADALRGAAVVLDATNDSSKGAHALLVDGTRRVLATAKAEGVTAKRLPDVAGPEVIRYADLVRRWAKAAGAARIVVPVPVPGAYGAYLRSGKMCRPDRAVGKRTYGEWLDEVAKARARA